MNTLRERDTRLAEMHHPRLLERVAEVLDEQMLFDWTRPNQVVVRADAVARAVLRRTPPLTERDLYTWGGNRPPAACTLHMTPATEEVTGKLLERIVGRIETQVGGMERERRERVGGLLRAPGQAYPFGRALPQAAKELCGPARQATRRRLTFRRPAEDTRSLRVRWHKLTLQITVPRDAPQQLAAALQAYLADRFPTRQDRDDLADVLHEQARQEGSELAQLLAVLDMETLGQVKKRAQVCYLIYMQELLEPTAPAQRPLRDLVRRLNALEAYLQQPGRADAEYSVTYQGQTFDLRALFGPAFTYDELPVVPLVEGQVGETTDLDTGERRYIYSVRLKLNGPVTRAGNQSSFRYHCRLIREGVNAQGAELTPERHLRLALLYAWMFTRLGDPTYDPATDLDERILPLLRAPSALEAATPLAALWQEVVAACERQEELLTTLAGGLRNVLRRRTPTPSRFWPLQINLLAGLIEPDRERLLDGALFRMPLGGERKPYLAYIRVGPPQMDPDVFFKLGAEIRVDDVQAFATDGDPETYSIAYDVADLQLLPVQIILESAATAETAPPAKAVAGEAGVLIPLAIKDRPDAHQADPVRWFIYRYVVTLLTYLGVRALARATPPTTFLAVTRRHRRALEAGSDENDPDGFLATLGKVVAQVLSIDRPANSQGLLPDGKTQKWKEGNAAASLYAPLPKIFTFNEDLPDDPPNLVLVIVSSRKSDHVQGLTDGRATVYGEVVEIARINSRQARVRRLDTFSGTYSTTDLHHRPMAIIDRIHHLYAAGYRHIMYIARSPYTRTLHLTHGTGDDEGLFFLSKPIITACTAGRPDLRLYPVFQDQYSAMKIAKPDATALYIQDTTELLQVVDDGANARQLMVFLNLFSGHPGVGRRGEDLNYHGVVSYATLLNIYGGVLDERALRADLLYDDGGPATHKATLVRYLTLFHLSRFEAARQEIALKLDPYSGIIGDESVGAAAVRQHARAKVAFNFLAFLTAVRNMVTHPRRSG